MSDALDALEAAAQATRQQRRTRTPEAKAKRNRGRAQKRRGSDAERMIAGQLGPSWRSIPLSGSLGGDLRGDVRYEGTAPFPAVRLCEVKRRAGAFMQWNRWLDQGGGVDFLAAVPGGSAEPLIVCRLSTWTRLLGAAGLE